MLRKLKNAFKKQHEWRTELLHAISIKDHKQVESILETGLNPNFKRVKDQLTPLDLAIDIEDLDTILLLLNYQNIIITTSHILKTFQKNNAKLILTLLECFTPTGLPPASLAFAFYFNVDKEIFKYLISHSKHFSQFFYNQSGIKSDKTYEWDCINWDTNGVKSQPCINLCECMRENLYLLEFALQKNKLNLNSDFVYNIFKHAVNKNDLDCLTLLLDHDKTIPLKNFHYVATYGRREAVKLFLDRGAKVSDTGQHWGGNLSYAILNSNVESAMLLIEAKSDINIMYNMGTPLHYAVVACNPILVKALLEVNADMFASNKTLGSPYDLAKRLSNRYFFKCLFPPFKPYATNYTVENEKTIIELFSQKLRYVFVQGITQKQSSLSALTWHASAIGGDKNILKLILDFADFSKARLNDSQSKVFPSKLGLQFFSEKVDQISESKSLIATPRSESFKLST